MQMLEAIVLHVLAVHKRQKKLCSLHRSERGTKYIPTAVDFATRYREEFPLSSETA